MTFVQLNYILTIAEAKSLNKAAEILFVSQPSLSSAVKELETELGITIFNRGGRGVTLTADGAEFLLHAKAMYGQYTNVLEKYGKGGNYKKKFGVSTQHYTFAVKAFTEMAKQFDMSQYEFYIRETRTSSVISDVQEMKSEIGVLYMSDMNRKYMTKLLKTADLEFYPLVESPAYVYLDKHHPLAREKEISFAQLNEFPCLSFDQGDNSAFYLAEEILATNDYAQTIKATDRATMLNLMTELNGYTLCSGVIRNEMNGAYLAIPFRADEENPNSVMTIGYIKKKNMNLSRMGSIYIEKIKELVEK